MQKSDVVLRHKALKSELIRVVEELKKAGVKRIILFGSLAKDDIGPASDIDLLYVIIHSNLLSSRKLRKILTRKQLSTQTRVQLTITFQKQEEDTLR